MSDRCYTQLICRAQDRERFEELFSEETALPNGLIHFAEPQADAAFLVDDNDSGLLPDDIPYSGNHFEGDEYGPAEFACNGKDFHYFAGGGDGLYLIRFDAKGRPNKKHLAQVENFIAFRAEVTALLLATNDKELPRTCILTGAPGEDPNDCTTHKHE